MGRRNKVYGCIYKGGPTRETSNTGGVALSTRGATAATQVQDTLIKDTVVIQSGAGTWGGVGLNIKATYNTQIENVTVVTGINSGFHIRLEPTMPGGGIYSAYMLNCLSFSNLGDGFFIDPGIQTWTVDYPRSFGNTTAYDPSTSVNYQHRLSTEVNPGFTNNCYVWIPDNSPMKGAGLGGADIGANVLYKYNSTPGDATGTITTEPLWDLTTGEFPHGAIITGVNDTATTSCYNVHTRLGINPANFPSGYGGPGTVPDTTPPATPTGVTVS
jgi:hypothetical protein